MTIRRRPAQTLTFGVGETQKTITVSTTDDEISESTEDFGVVLSGAVGANINRALAKGRINDNDSAVQYVGSDVTSVTVFEGDVFEVPVRYRTFNSQGNPAAAAKQSGSI